MPTENRSNTEMIAVPRFIGKEPLDGSYYAAECLRCGWIGSSAECTEDAQCTRIDGASMCLGDTEEVGTDRLLGIIQSMAQAIEQHQGKPVAFARSLGSCCWEEMSGEGLDICLSMPEEYEVRYLYNSPAVGDAWEVERLTRKCQNADLALRVQTQNCERLRGDLTTVKADRDAYGQNAIDLRAQLAERDALLRECQLALEKAGYGTWQIDELLSASAGPSAPAERDERNTGHGHVFLRPDGVRAKCGGPGLCKECSADQVRAALERKPA